MNGNGGDATEFILDTTTVTGVYSPNYREGEWTVIEADYTAPNKKDLVGGASTPPKSDDNPRHFMGTAYILAGDDTRNLILNLRHVANDDPFTFVGMRKGAQTNANRTITIIIIIKIPVLRDPLSIPHLKIVIAADAKVHRINTG